MRLRVIWIWNRTRLRWWNAHRGLYLCVERPSRAVLPSDWDRDLCQDFGTRVSVVGLTTHGLYWYF